MTAPGLSVRTPGFWIVHAALFAIATLALFRLQIAAVPPYPELAPLAGPVSLSELLIPLFSGLYDAELARAAGLSAVGTALLALSSLRRSSRESPHGSARFATRSEAKRARLLDPSGVLLGRWSRGGALLRNGEHFHLLYALPPGGGKTRGFVIPNLLSWSGSAVVLDVKHEIFGATSGYRQGQGHAVYLWSPADPQCRSHRYNPMDMIRSDPSQRMSDLQRLAALLIPDSDGENPIWANESRNLFLGLALWVLEDPNCPSTLGEVYRRVIHETRLEERIGELLERDSNVPSAPCRRLLGHWASLSDRQRMSVLMGVTSSLVLWGNPVIDAATSHSDFRFEELRRRPMTIYVGVTPNDLKALSPLLALFFEQMVAAMSRALPGPDERTPVLGLLDEFAALGRMQILAESMAFLRGYAVRLALVVQGLGQLERHYGRAGLESILQNAGIQLFAAANDPSTARYISERLGKRTVRTESRSQSLGWGKSSRSTSFASRDLLMPQEVHALDTDALIVLREGAPPVLGRKIRFDAERVFWERAYVSVCSRWGWRRKGALRAPAAVPRLVLPEPESPRRVPDAETPPEDRRRARAAALFPQLHEASEERAPGE